MSENFYQNLWTQIKKFMQEQQKLTFYRDDDGFDQFLQYIPKSEIPDTGKISWGKHLHYEFNGLKNSVEVCFHCETSKQFREKLDLLFQNDEELKNIKGKGLASLKWCRLSIPGSKTPEEISGFASKLAKEMIAFETRYGQKILKLIQKVEEN